MVYYKIIYSLIIYPARYNQYEHSYRLRFTHDTNV
jgi:hypothetical protein